jgi:membrane protein
MATSDLTTEQQITSIWGLGGLSVFQLTKRVWQGINDNNLFGRASELAYSYLLAVFPMLIFLLSCFGLFASQSSGLLDKLFFYFSQALPPAAYKVVTGTLSEVTNNSGGAKVTLGLLLALVSASGGMNSMISALNGAYSVRDSRPWYKTRAIAIALTVAISILIFSALFMVLVGGNVADWIGYHLDIGSFAIITWKIIQWPAALLFVVLSFSLIYYFGPDVKEQHWYWITPGSLLGVLLWVAFSAGFRVYLHFFNSYSRTYGSLGAVIILLLWFYVTGLAFTVGGQINAEIEHAAALHGHPEAKAPGEKVSNETKQAA